MPPTPAGALPPSSLLAASDGCWFELRPRGRVSLERRSTLKLLLAALLEQRRRSPGMGLDSKELVAAGWPKELLRHASGLNRLRVAMATLRTLGLREVLLHDGHGYFLDPAMPLSIVTSETESR